MKRTKKRTQKRPRIVVYMEGGIVQSMLADTPVEVVVVDADDDVDETHPNVVAGACDDPAELAYVNIWGPYTRSPAALAKITQACEAGRRAMAAHRAYCKRAKED